MEQYLQNSGYQTYRVYAMLHDLSKERKRKFSMGCNFCITLSQVIPTDNIIIIQFYIVNDFGIKLDTEMCLTLGTFLT